MVRAMNDRVQAVDRAIDILMALVPGPKTLTEVCRATGLTKPTAFRLLGSLGARGMILKDPGQDNSYMLGPNLLPLLHGVSVGLGSLGMVARPVLQQLTQEKEDTVTLHVAVGIERVCIEEIRSPHALQYTASPGSRAPLHVGSAGKVLIAFLDDDQREKTIAVLPKPLRSLTDETITEVETLRKELARTRQRGWATSSGERVSGAAAVSVPVMAKGQLVAALSVLGPATRLPATRLRELAGGLERPAREIGRLFQGSGSDA